MAKRIKLMRAPGAYVQGKDALLEFADRVEYLGKSFLFIAGGRSGAAAKVKIEKSFEGKDAKRRYENFSGHSTISTIEALRKIVKEDSIDVIVGIGGGSVIDTAKAVAFYEGKAVVIVPTVASCDAACTGLSVIYNDDHTFNTYLCYPKNPEMVIVDSQVIADSPVKFLVAGMGDALATYFEALTCVRTAAPSVENGGITKVAFAITELCYNTIIEHGPRAIVANENHVVTDDLEAAIEASIYLSGVGCDNAGVSIAHAIYNGMTDVDECTSMHGDVVAFGTICQLLFECAPTELLDEVMNFCYAIGSPMTLADMGITDKERCKIAAAKAASPTDSAQNEPGGCTPEELYDVMILADALGKKFKEARQ